MIGTSTANPLGELEVFCACTFVSVYQVILDFKKKKSFWLFKDVGKN